jgi:hypothetical protein
VELTAKTPAYATGTIEKTVVTFIIDTGAGICLISKVLLDRLGWSIDEMSDVTLVVADGSQSPVLGLVKAVPVTFGLCTIPIDMIVTESTSYDVILGTSWLELANATINLHQASLTISHCGQKHTVPLDMNQAAQSITTHDDEEDSDYSEQEVNHSTLNKRVFAIQDTLPKDPVEQHAALWRNFTHPQQSRTRPSPIEPPFSEETSDTEPSDNESFFQDPITTPEPQPEVESPKPSPQERFNEFVAAHEAEGDDTCLEELKEQFLDQETEDE